MNLNKNKNIISRDYNLVKHLKYKNLNKTDGNFQVLEPTRSAQSFLFWLEYITEVILAGAYWNTVRIFLQLSSFFFFASPTVINFYWDRITVYFCCWGGNLLTSKHSSPHQFCLLKMFILFVCKHSNINKIFPYSFLSFWSQREPFYKHGRKPFFSVSVGPAFIHIGSSKEFEWNTSIFSWILLYITNFLN